MRIGRGAAAASLAVLALAGCGGDDDSDGTERPPAESATTDGAGAATTDAPADAGGGGGLGMGPETFARQLIVALRADSFTVDGTTITMEFSDGSTADAESQCTIAKATVGANATVVLSYPDGEASCE